MPWVKLDDNFVDHPKVSKLSDGAFRVHLSALSYASRNLTDGHVDRHLPRRLTNHLRVASFVRELVESGLWDETDDGYQIHDYLDFQPSRAEILERREKNAERKRRSRSKAGHGVTDAVTGDVTPRGSPRPPSRPVPKHSVSSSTEPQGSPALDDDDRISLTAEALGLADHQRALHDGVEIRNTRAHLASCIARRLDDARTAVAANPDATVDELVEIIEPPPKPERANPHVRTWEETQAARAAEAAELEAAGGRLTPEQRRAAIAAAKAGLARSRQSHEGEPA